jgi:hypothetical protein
LACSSSCSQHEGQHGSSSTSEQCAAANCARAALLGCWHGLLGSSSSSHCLPCGVGDWGGALAGCRVALLLQGTACGALGCVCVGGGADRHRAAMGQITKFDATAMSSQEHYTKFQNQAPDPEHTGSTAPLILTRQCANLKETNKPTRALCHLLLWHGMLAPTRAEAKPTHQLRPQRRQQLQSSRQQWPAIMGSRIVGQQQQQHRDSK